MGSLLYQRSVPITDMISLYVPTVGEVFDNQDLYYEIVFAFTSTPYDMMVQLDDVGIDFTKINEYELFCLLFPSLQQKDTSLLFGDLDLKNAKPMKNTNTEEVVIRDASSGLVIDRTIHARIAQTLRKLLNLTKNDKRPGNEEARKYLIERARKKLKRRLKQKQEDSQMENYIISLVNTEQFPYNYESVRDITIYQFNASLAQIAHKISYDQMMGGYFAGTVKLDNVAEEDRTWIRMTK